MQKREVINEAEKIFWVFIIGNIFGYLFETLLFLYVTGKYQGRKGLIYGPFNPVYGIGAVAYYLIFKKIKTEKVWKIFIISMILGGITEYLCSFAQEKIFHTISWDYSDLLFNINGRTSLKHCIAWGLIGIFYKKIIEPFVNKLDNLLKNNIVQVVTVLMVVFMTFNITISSAAGIRQKDRYEGIEPRNKFEEFLDTHYSDDYMNKVYFNKINIEK